MFGTIYMSFGVRKVSYVIAVYLYVIQYIMYTELKFMINWFMIKLLCSM